MKALLFLGHRNLRIVGSVLVLHVLVLWALQTGLLQRAVESVVAVQLVSDLVDAPRVNEAPRPVPVSMPHAAAPQAAVQQAVATPQASAAPVLAVAAETPAVAATAVAVPTAPSAPAAVATGHPVASAKVELPDSAAEYLHNPKAPYPALSARRNEQGRVVVEVLIGIDGTAHKAQIKESSGYPRLDQQALATVLSWHYVPGKRGGVPQEMTYSVPINFVLE